MMPNSFKPAIMHLNYDHQCVYILLADYVKHYCILVT